MHNEWQCLSSVSGQGNNSLQDDAVCRDICHTHVALYGSFLEESQLPYLPKPHRPGYHLYYKVPVILIDSSPLAPLPWQMWFQQRPYFIAYIMPMIGSLHFLSRCFLLTTSIISHSPLLCRHYLINSTKDVCKIFYENTTT